MISYSKLSYSTSQPSQNIDFQDEVQSVRECAKNLTAMNVSKIIALGHAGINMDKKIATEIPEVDIVVGGHTNTFLYTGI